MEIRTGIARSRVRGETGPESGDIEIYYEDMGDPNDPAVLLIMGLGAQLLLWRKEFCEKLVDQGLRVIRYDNRDVGLSTKVTGRHTGVPLAPRMVRSFLGLRSPAVYTLEDVADDAAALLDHLKIDTAHIVGASMGGMIAQIFAARHKVRTKTLAIIFSSNNQALLPPPGPRQLLAILQKPKDATRDAIEGYDRSYYPAGVGRHFAAVLGSGSLLAYDRQIRVPTVVIHGKADKLMRPFGGRAVARAIKGARLVLFDGMGHDLPRELWDDIVGELKTTFAATA